MTPHNEVQNNWHLNTNATENTVYPKVSGPSRNEIYAYTWYYSLLSTLKGYDGKIY